MSSPTFKVKEASPTLVCDDKLSAVLVEVQEEQAKAAAAGVKHLPAFASQTPESLEIRAKLAHRSHRETIEEMKRDNPDLSQRSLMALQAKLDLDPFYASGIVDEAVVDTLWAMGHRKPEDIRRFKEDLRTSIEKFSPKEVRDFADNILVAINRRVTAKRAPKGVPPSELAYLKAYWKELTAGPLDELRAGLIGNLLDDGEKDMLKAAERKIWGKHAQKHGRQGMDLLYRVFVSKEPRRGPGGMPIGYGEGYWKSPTETEVHNPGKDFVWNTTRNGLPEFLWEDMIFRHADHFTEQSLVDWIKRGGFSSLSPGSQRLVHNRLELKKQKHIKQHYQARVESGERMKARSAQKPELSADDFASREKSWKADAFRSFVSDLESLGPRLSAEQVAQAMNLFIDYGTALVGPRTVGSTKAPAFVDRGRQGDLMHEFLGAVRVIAREGLVYDPAVASALKQRVAMLAVSHPELRITPEALEALEVPSDQELEKARRELDRANEESSRLEREKAALYQSRQSSP